MVTLGSVTWILLAVSGTLPVQNGRTEALPRTQELLADLMLERRAALALLMQAEQAAASVLFMMEIGEDDDLEQRQSRRARQQFGVLQPSTRLLLAANFELLSTIADALDDLQTIIEEDLAEELTISEDVLAELEIEEDEGILVEEQERDLPQVGDILAEIDVEIDLAGGACGDPETLVRVIRGDIGRALGRVGRFGGDDPGVNAERRRLAVRALRAHHLALQDAVTCLEELLRP